MAIVNEYTLKISVKDAQANVDELNKSLAAQKDLIQDLTDEIADYEEKLGNMNPRDKNRIKKTEELIAVTKKQLTQEKKGLKDVNAERKTANTQLKEATKNQADFGGVLGVVDNQLGGAISGMKKFTGGIKKAITQMGLLRLAIIATGVGALLIAVTSLVAVFKQSEEGQEKMAIAMAKVGAVVKVVMDMFADLGQAIIDAVKAPLNSVKQLETWLQLFMVDPLVAAKLAYIGVADAAKKVAEDAKAEAKAASVYAKNRIKAHHIDRALLVERAKANREINDIRLQAEDRIKNTAAERIALLRKAQQIEEGITKKEIESKQILIDAQVLEMKQGLNTTEAKDKLAKLQAQLIDLDTKKLRSQRLLQTQITTALREEQAAKEEAAKEIEDAIKAEEKRIADEIKKGKTAETKRLKDLQSLKAQIADAEAVTDDERRALQIQKTIDHYDKLIELAKAQGIDTAQLKKSQDAAIDKLNRDAAKNEIGWANLTQDEKMRVLSDGLNDLANVLGEATAAGKAAAIAATTIDTFQSATASYKSLAGIPIVGPALGSAAAGLAIASGFKQIQAIKATPLPTLAGVSSPSVSASTPSVSGYSVPPNFNTVGASSTDQLATAIGGQVQRPTRAYVVSTDVTSAQSLDRSIITGATIGG
tara:strand:+ start:118 stop:2064 length:1947 start_codon:yes stop_codon:yes gene_type:complete